MNNTTGFVNATTSEHPDLTLEGRVYLATPLGKRNFD